ncbi:DUF2231 domain-containing protein [Nocardioides sp. AN3]
MATPVVRLTQQIEGATSLDGLAHALQPLADAVVADPMRRHVLQGHWLGHALHPLMTDLPIGFWTSANVLDLLGGRSARPAARMLTGLGVASALPTALTGWAEFAGLRTDRDRRTATVHAIGNIVASTCYFASWRARRRGHWTAGVAWGLAGATVASGAGLLGGHLAIAREVSSKNPVFEGD